MKYTEDLTKSPYAVEDISDFVNAITADDLKEFLCTNAWDSMKVSLREALRDASDRPDRMRFRSLYSHPNGYPLLMGGWDNLTGVAWFLTSVYAEQYPVQTLKGILECRDEALQECTHLVNVMMRSNTRHVRLLDSIGATFTGPIESIGGEPFQAFYIKRKDEHV